MSQPLDRRAVRDLRTAADVYSTSYPSFSAWTVANVRQISVCSPPMISLRRPVAWTACRKASSSNAFIDVRSISSMPSSSDRIDGSVGLLKPSFTPTVERTIGMPYALAVMASSRTCSSTSSGAFPSG